ncbi:MAG: pentapeptide repeat-containing protein [Caulobacterales bacterium]|nr:pentapeptide repeat-containing protein [Caulobacterales bacterium]
MSLPEPPAPAGLAGRQDVASATRDGPARFSGWNLTAADLSRLDLQGCVFERCRAGQANFANAGLAETQFLGCDLNNSRWAGASLSSAVFRDCKLTGALLGEIRSFGLTFERCLLVSAQLPGFSFRRQTLDGVDFQGADLAEADFREAVLTDCNLKDANLARARFEGADLRGAEIGPIAAGDLPRFKGALISRAQAAIIAGGLGLKVV